MAQFLFTAETKSVCFDLYIVNSLLKSKSYFLIVHKPDVLGIFNEVSSKSLVFFSDI